ncbi:hypothetical protein M9434_003807 [Picochlorum sp. BPE23]|nr:hypothetical protein M9434_003807 [Picochlorum sp. BPE23]
MSKGTSSDHTGDTNEFCGQGNGYRGIISLLEVLKNLDHQAIIPTGTSSGAAGPSKGQPPSFARRPPNLPKRDQGAQTGQATRRVRLNRSGFRKRTREGRYLSDITLEEVLQYVHLPSSEASKRLGLGLTSFKRVCRSVGIMSWPYKAGKQPSREELITSALESGSKQSRERAEDPAVLTPGAEASLRQLIAFCPGDFKEFLIFKLRQFLETSYSMRYDCGFTIFNDPILLALVTKLSE